ncbi:MAG: chemotaxis protein CheA [SAR324 cluster bacterium]|nr:chemotaxis protein CheA [SAR324 cluster bacterium]
MSFQKKWEKICEKVSNMDGHATIMDWGDLLRAIEAVGKATDTPAWFSSIHQHFDRNIGDILTEQQSEAAVLPGLKEFCQQLKLVQQRDRTESVIRDLVQQFSHIENPTGKDSGDSPQRIEKTSNDPQQNHQALPPLDEANVVQHLPSEAWTDNLYSDFINEAEDMLDETDPVLKKLQQTGDSDQNMVNTLFRTMHTIKGTAGFLGLIDISVLAHHTEDLLMKIRDGALVFSSDNIQTIIQATDTVRALLDQLKMILRHEFPIQVNVSTVFSRLRDALAPDVKKSVQSGSSTGKPPSATSKVPKRIGDLLIENGAVTPEQIESALEEQQRPLGQILVDQGAISKQVVDQTLKQMGSPATTQSAMLDMVKVPSISMDELSELIGEMVVELSLISQQTGTGERREREINERLNQMSHIIEQMRDRVLGMRMFPVSHVFAKLSRQVRDLSLKCGKAVNLVREGEETLVDKTVIDGIYSPLMHLVRNSIDHGLESPKVREAAGKSPQGTLSLIARHLGDSVMIEIRDDGNGLNRQKILKKALENGLVKDGAALSDAQIDQLIFQPGFSTAEAVTDVSGRGVGMDVVRQDINKLRGKISIQSVTGKGTSFQIKLPLSTSIIEGLVTRVGDYQFVFPLLEILCTVTPENSSLQEIHGQAAQCFVLDHEIIPILRLYEFYEIPTEILDPAKGIMVVIRQENRKIGVLVDEVLHRQQIVIKSLGERFQHLPAITGGTILGDGHIGLIISPEQLIEHSDKEKHHES